jgi:hypothetical protein
MSAENVEDAINDTKLKGNEKITHFTLTHAQTGVTSSSCLLVDATADNTSMDSQTPPPWGCTMHLSSDSRSSSSTSDANVENAEEYTRPADRHIHVSYNKPQRPG